MTETPPGTHRGIMLRVRLPHLPAGQQDIIVADSDILHLQGLLAGVTPGDESSWVPLLPIILNAGSCLIEARPVYLPDVVPE